MSEQVARVEKENDFIDAVVGFAVGFGFFMGIGILGMILQYVIAN